MIIMCEYAEIEDIKLSNGKTTGQINDEGSEDLVEFNRKERSYKVIARVADKGQGGYAYLLNK